MSQSTGNRQVVVAESGEPLIREAARRFVEAANESASRGTFHVALSGGSTPRPLYEALAGPPFRNQIDWSRIQVFFSDERFVSPDSPESNFHMANQALLSKVPIPERFVHPVSTVGVSPEESAALYEEGLRRVFAAGLDETHFDLILLGLGPDGHTASLFPDTAALFETQHLVTANFVPKLDAWRITFTYPLLNAARSVMFMVQGADKAQRVSEVLEGSADLPAARVQVADGKLIWLLDAAAAAKIPEEQRTAPAGGDADVRPDVAGALQETPSQVREE